MCIIDMSYREYKDPGVARINFTYEYYKLVRDIARAIIGDIQADPAACYYNASVLVSSQLTQRVAELKQLKAWSGDKDRLAYLDWVLTSFNTQRSQAQTAEPVEAKPKTKKSGKK